MFYPATRLRRLRINPAIRNMVAETSISVDNLIMPYFVIYGSNKKIPVKSMPGVFQYSADLLITELKEAYGMGIKTIILFGIPEFKDERGDCGVSDAGVVQNAIRLIKKEIPEMIVIADVCLCEYTSHGHCGILNETIIDNDQTVQQLANMALSFARAGADIVAPSDMMDGRVGLIREFLDSENFINVLVLSYSAKYSSAFYGPFREAAGSAPKFGDRKTYQMDCRNSEEALREAAQDIEEGADIVMVKPALSYLDIISRVKKEAKVPVCAYSVSGEYSMIKAAAQNGWIDEKKIAAETLISIRRAGADMIITYYAKEFAWWLKNGEVAL